MTSRPTVAEISQKALLENFRRIREKIGANPICPVVKANAYGHDAVLVARTLAPLGIGFWGVHSVDEALALRQGGIGGEILILGGCYPGEVEEIFQNKLTPALHSLENFLALLARIEDKRAKQPLPAHLKLDTGMGRFGFRPEALGAFIEKYHSQKKIIITGVFAHVPRSEDLTYDRSQKEMFEGMLAELKKNNIDPGIRHHSNSIVALRVPEMRYDLVRLGLILHGIYPHACLKDVLDLKPVMTLATEIVSIREIPKGVGLSYGHDFVTTRSSRIATLPVGYADGYPRGCGNRAQVAIRGKRLPIVGRVCMDLSLVDVTDLPEAQLGDRVELFGENISVDELAKMNQTISYEILCGVSPRVPRKLLQS